MCYNRQWSRLAAGETVTRVFGPPGRHAAARGPGTGQEPQGSSMDIGWIENMCSPSWVLLV
jgi:hypothetical protein